MVGHTHEDIDALFGNLGKWLRKHNALTVPGIFMYLYDVSLLYYLPLALLQGCRECNKGVKICSIIKEVMDVKAWLLPCTEQLHNHSHPHIFKFYKCKNGSTEMKYKRWNHDEWLPDRQLGLKLLKVVCAFQLP